jgi:hypothetical protein
LNTKFNKGIYTACQDIFLIKLSFLRQVFRLGSLKGGFFKVERGDALDLPYTESRRFPSEVEGIQVNFCKNITCKSCGQPFHLSSKPLFIGIPTIDLKGTLEII